MKLISPTGAIKAALTCNTKDLNDVIRFLKATMKKTWLEERPYCEITFKTNQVEFVVHGARKTLLCEAFGPARVNISFAYFLHLINDRPKIKTIISVGDEFMIVNDTMVCVETWFFEDDNILRSINLPVNYGIYDLLNLSTKYTEREIEFSKLSDEYHAAFKTLANDTKIITGKLKKYGFSKDEVEKFIHNKIFKQS